MNIRLALLVVSAVGHANVAEALHFIEGKAAKVALEAPELQPAGLQRLGVVEQAAAEAAAPAVWVEMELADPIAMPLQEAVDTPLGFGQPDAAAQQQMAGDPGTDLRFRVRPADLGQGGGTGFGLDVGDGLAVLQTRRADQYVRHGRHHAACYPPDR